MTQHAGLDRTLTGMSVPGETYAPDLAPIAEFMCLTDLKLSCAGGCKDLDVVAAGTPRSRRWGLLIFECR